MSQLLHDYLNSHRTIGGGSGLVPLSPFDAKSVQLFVVRQAMRAVIAHKATDADKALLARHGML